MKIFPKSPNARMEWFFVALAATGLLAVFATGDLVWLIVGYGAAIPAVIYEPDYPSGL